MGRSDAIGRSQTIARFRVVRRGVRIAEYRWSAKDAVSFGYNAGVLA
jgi:hypothetical protein